MRTLNFNYKNWLRNLLLVTMVLMLVTQTLVISTPQTVYATGDEEETDNQDNEDSEDEDDESSSESSSSSSSSTSQNAFEGLEKDKRDLISLRASYDMRVHYIVTYAILMDEYLAEGAYSDMVNRGKLPDNYNQGIAMPEFATGSVNMALTNHVSEDASDHKEEDGNREDEKALREQIDGLVAKIADEHSEAFTDVLFYATETPTKVETGGLGGFKNTSLYTGTMYPHSDGHLLTYNENTTKQLNQLKKGTDLHLNMNGFVREKLMQRLKALDFEKPVEETITYPMIYTHVYPDNSEYNKIYNDEIKLVVDFSRSFGKFREQLQDTNLSQIQVGKPKKNYTFEDVEAIATFAPNALIYYKQAIENGVVKKDNPLYTKNISLKEMTRVLIDVQPELKQLYTSSVNKLRNSKDVEDLIELQKQLSKSTEDAIEDSKEGDIRGLAWLPLRFKFDGTIKTEKEEKEYKTLIKYFDDGEIDEEGQVLVHNKQTYKGFRLLQLNDLINIPVKSQTNGESVSKARASPYLSWDYDTRIEGTDEEYKVGVTYDGIPYTHDIMYFTGIKVYKEKPSTFVGKVINLFKAEKDKVGYTSGITTDDLAYHKTVNQKMISYMNADGERIEKFDKVGDLVLGVDNYGNLISAENMRVVVPYWANTNLQSISKHLGSGGTKEYLSNPILKKLETTEMDLVASNKITTTELDVKLSETSLSDLGNFNENYLTELNAVLKSKQSDRLKLITYKNLMDGNEDINTRQALALAIVQDTSSVIKEHNELFLKVADEAQELYITPSDAGALGDDASRDELDKFNALDLLEKIKLILDIGFYELIRLTIASWVVSFYTGSVSNFSLSNIFHTQVIADTPFWTDIITSIALLLVGFTAVYIAIMGIKLMRHTITVGHFFKVIFQLMLVLLIPTVIYAPMVHWTINKPTQMILHKQMEQVSMVDSYIEEHKEYAEADPLYAKLFGHVEDKRKGKEQYLVDLYTTEHVKGFNIKDHHPEEDTIVSKFVRNNLNRDIKWGKNELVKVRVSIFDLFEWVKSDSGDLFAWLHSQKSADYPEIQRYTEYSIDTSVVIPSLDVDSQGREWKASEVFKEIYNNMEAKSIQNNISGLYNLTSAFRTRRTMDNSGGLSDNEREMLVRDISFVGDIRERIYGGRTNVSIPTQGVFDKYSISKDTINLQSDLLGLEDIVDDFIRYRNSESTTLEGDVFDINKAVVDNYILNLSIVRESASASDGIYARAEYPMVVMKTWFELNKLLGVKFYPTQYGVDTITFDSYMRLVFIPLGYYFEADTADVQNVAEFLALREHPGTLLFLFLPLVLGLMLFGFLYLFIFYVGLLLMMMGAFIYNNIITNNTENKSWLGVIFIVGSFALVKTGLIVVWSLLATLLNYTYANNGTVLYPYTLVHSLVLLAYVVLSLIFLWKFVVMNVLKDKANLGGQSMLDSTKGLISDIKGKLSGTMSTNNKLGGSAKGILDSHKLKEGGKGALNQLGRGSNLLSKSAQVGGGMINSVRSTQMAQSIGHSLQKSAVQGFHNTADGIYSIFNKDGEKLEVNKNTADLLLNADSKDKTMVANSKMLSEYDSIVPSERVGLSKEEQDNLETNGAYGMDLTDTNTKFMVMDTENEQSALLMQKYLKEDMGVNASVDGSQVIFDTNEYDMKSTSGRKALFGGLIQNSAREVSTMNADYTAKADNDSLSYFGNDDGTVSLKVGKDGISNTALNEVLGSSSIQDNFIVESLPEETGNGYATGEVVLRPNNSNVATNIHDNMANVFKMDDTVRQKNGEEVRTSNNLDSMVEVGSTDKELVESINKQKLKGMSFQDGKLYFDSNDSHHQEFITSMTGELNKSVSEQKEARKDLAIQLASHVTGGQGEGIKTQMYTSEDIQKDEELVEQFRSYGKDVFQPTKNMAYFGGKHSNEIAKRIEDSIAYSKLDKEDGERFIQSQDTIQKQGFEVVKQATKGEGMTQVAHNKTILNQLTTMAERENINKDVVNSIKGEHLQLEKDRKNNKISETEYETSMSNLVSKSTNKLKREEGYTDLMTSVLRDSLSKGKTSEETAETIRETLDNYVDVKRKLETNGVDDIGSSVQMYKELNLGKHGIDLTKIKSVNVGQDGKVHVETDGFVPKDTLDNFVKDIAKNVDTM